MIVQNTPRKVLHQLFPNVAANPSSLSISSPEEWKYNCVAWALDLKDRWLEPSPAGVWPVAEEGFSIEAYARMFAHHGFEECSNGAAEKGFTKIVIYGSVARDFSHVAKQLPNGKWSSKLGELSDVKHTTPEVLSSAGYGTPMLYMRRAVPSSATP